MKIDIQYAIKELVETLLPRFSEGKVLQVNVEGSFSHYTENDSQEELVYITFIFERTSNYTKVLMEYRGMPFSINQICAWNMTSNHDSCWIEDGVQRELNIIEREYVDKFDESIRKDVHKFISFGLKSPKVLDGYTEPIDRRTGSGYNTKYRVHIERNNKPC